MILTDPPLVAKRIAIHDGGMPLVNIIATSSAFDDDLVGGFVDAVTRAAWRAESIPDDPLRRARAVVVWTQQPPSTVWWGGSVADSLVRGVFVTLTVSDGVLDPVRRDRFASDLDAAAKAATRPGDDRIVHTSVVFNEVPEGRWGRDGRVVRLPEMAAVAGFEHLAAIAQP
jgi:hypothetical protein